MNARTALLETPRGKVEYAVCGHGPAILALHGAMGGYDQGLLLARAAVGDSQFQVVAPSRPGYLGTPLGVGRSPEEQADACAAVLDVAGIGAAAVIAISGGGQCALQFALGHSDRCRALVMISACSAPLHATVPPIRFQIFKLAARVPVIANLMRSKAIRDPDAAARRSIPDPAVRARTLNDPEAGPLMAALQQSTFEHMAKRLPGTQNDILQSRSPFAYPVERITAPVLVVHGTGDEAVPVAHARALAATVPNGQLLLLEGGRHTSLFTHLHEIRPRVIPFLTQLCTGQLAPCNTIAQ